jgi:hypothetical protein
MDEPSVNMGLCYEATRAWNMRQDEQSKGQHGARGDVAAQLAALQSVAVPTESEPVEYSALDCATTAHGNEV